MLPLLYFVLVDLYTRGIFLFSLLFQESISQFLEQFFWRTASLARNIILLLLIFYIASYLIIIYNILDNIWNGIYKMRQ